MLLIDSWFMRTADEFQVMKKFVAFDVPLPHTEIFGAFIPEWIELDLLIILMLISEGEFYYTFIYFNYFRGLSDI